MFDAWSYAEAGEESFEILYNISGTHIISHALFRNSEEFIFVGQAAMEYCNSILKIINYEFYKIIYTRTSFPGHANYS